MDCIRVILSGVRKLLLAGGGAYCNFLPLAGLSHLCGAYWGPVNSIYICVYRQIEVSTRHTKQMQSHFFLIQ